MGESDFFQEQDARRESIEIHDSTRNAAIGKKRRAFSTYATTGSLFLKTLKIPIRQIKVFRPLGSEKTLTQFPEIAQHPVRK